MMKEENLDQMFRKLQGSFDLEEPRAGHQDRFLRKLRQEGTAIPPEARPNRLWKPMAIAASLAFFGMLAFQWYSNPVSRDEQVARISPEIAQTEFYFTNLVEEQLQQLESESTPETQNLVTDAMYQLEKLEASYKTMEEDLLNGGNSNLILSAMITNFQTRIDLLKEVLEKIETIKHANSYDNENYTI